MLGELSPNDQWKVARGAARVSAPTTKGKVYSLARFFYSSSLRIRSSYIVQPCTTAVAFGLLLWSLSFCISFDVVAVSNCRLWQPQSPPR